MKNQAKAQLLTLLEDAYMEHTISHVKYSHCMDILDESENDRDILYYISLIGHVDSI